MEGYIHSLESFGTVDGPGVRFVVFFQGCPMRCQYCHNPDTWNMQDAAHTMTADEIIDRVERNKSFYKTGGITATGGEPMLQIDFLTELFYKAKEKGIHTCLDTSGVMFPVKENEKTGQQMEKIDTLLSVTDLVMLDIKHMEEEAHKKLTMHSAKHSQSFAKYLDQKEIPIWIRHVVVPGITDRKEELEALGSFLAQLSHVEKSSRCFRNHSMGESKIRCIRNSLSVQETFASLQKRKQKKHTILSCRLVMQKGRRPKKRLDHTLSDAIYLTLRTLRRGTKNDKSSDM